MAMTAGRLGRLALCLAALPLLGLFYVRYVPFVGPFQAALVPILLAVSGLTLANPVWGTLAFVFAFPLINNLPYFFGLGEPLPMAPTALVLALCYLWAWLIRAAVLPPSRGKQQGLDRPLLMFVALVTVSGLVTFFRYFDFPPLRSDGFYELTTNMHRVSSGGAAMSVVFTSLCFLTGFAVFGVLRTTLRRPGLPRNALFAFSASAGLAVIFSFVQKFLDLKLGNNPLSISAVLINGTFKDAMSFGGFLGIVAPVFLAAIAWSRKACRPAFIGLFLASAGAILFTGSKSGLLIYAAASGFTAVLLIVLRPGNRGGRGVGNPGGGKRLARTVLVLAGGALLLWAGGRKAGLWKWMGTSASLSRLSALARDFNWEKILIVRADTLWPISVAMTRDYPLTGVGVGGYIIEMSNYAADMKLTAGTPESAENLPLHIVSELGLVGLLIAAWILLEIGRKIVSQWKSLASEPRDRFFLIGLAGGIFSFILVSQVHTFIWSYEIHYTFWLLVALVYGPGREGASDPGENKPAVPVRKSFVRRVAFPAVLLVFSAVHLWNSTHSLSLESRAVKYGFKQDFGFYQQEKTADGRDFRWTGKHAGTELVVEETRLEISLLASNPDIAERPVRVRVFLVKPFFREKRLLGELAIKDSDWQTREFALAPEDVGKIALLLFKVDRTWVPQKALRVPDPRHLGIAVGPIRFLPPRP
jgi:hypothetical protein